MIARGGPRLRALAGTTTSLLAAQLALGVAGILAARSLGPAGRGVVTAVVAWTQMLGWISLCGVNSALSVRVAGDRERGIGAALGNALAYALVVGAATAVVGVVVVAPLVAHLDHGARHLATLAFASVPLALLAEIVLSLTLALGRVGVFNAARIAGGVSVLAAVVALLALGALTPGRMIAATVGGGALSLVVAAWTLPWRSLAVAPRALASDVVFGLKVHLVSLIGLANLRLDVLVLAAVASAADVGVYGLANNLMMPVSTVASAAAALITPDVARVRGSGAVAEQLSLVRSSARIAVGSAAVAGIALAVAAPFLVPLVFGHGFGRAVAVVWILIPGFVVRTYTSLGCNGAIGMRRAWVGNVAEGAGLVVTAIALPLLLVRYGIVGAAAASTGAYAVSAATTWLCLARVRRESHAAPLRVGEALA